jgi:hypothetical protein
MVARDGRNVRNNRALPALLVGTGLGIIIGGLPFMLMEGTTTVSVLGIIGFIAGPTIGGIVASRFIRSAPSEASDRL